ncbi:MAG: hypothetical protein P9X24_05785 [Candidatus Hatepunaea meridiana]|nr:hypothetical protein [Candidatus Hatepunaea meridiana]
MPQHTQIEFTLNGRPIKRTIPSSMLLLNLLRDDLSLKGTNPGNIEGEYGVCMVLIDKYVII